MRAGPTSVRPSSAPPGGRRPRAPSGRRSRATAVGVVEVDRDRLADRRRPPCPTARPQTSSPAWTHARHSQPPASPDAPVTSARTASVGLLHETAYSSEPWPLLEWSVAGGGSRAARAGVGAALELAQHQPEQQVAPDGLQERRAVAVSCGSRSRAGCRRSDSRPSGHSATCSTSAASGPRSGRRHRQRRLDVGVDGAEHGAVADMDREADRIPLARRSPRGRATRHRRSGWRRRACPAAAARPDRRRRRRRRRRLAASCQIERGVLLTVIHCNDGVPGRVRTMCGGSRSPS